jgi:hypothetical protein
MPTDPAAYRGRKIRSLPYDENARAASVLFAPIVDGSEIKGYLPLMAIDNGDGTATLKVDAAFTGNITIGDVNADIKKVSGVTQTGADWTLIFQGLATEATLAAILAKIDIIVDGETPSGVIDGVNVNFTTAHQYKPTTTHLYLNGIRLKEGVGFDYVEQADHQTLTLSSAPQPGDVLLVDYRKL